MPINFNEPTTTTNYVTLVSGLVSSFGALAQWLDPAVAGTLTGTPTGAYRINAGEVQRFNGTSWAAQPVNGIQFSAGNAGNGRAPTSAFDVYRAAGDVISTVESGAGSSVSAAVRTKNATRSWLFGVGPGLGTDAWTLRDETAAITRLVVRSDGNVGIGDTNPGQRLVVNGSAVATALGAGVSVPSVTLHVDGGSTNEVARFAGTGDTYLSMYRSGTRRSYMQAHSTAGMLFVQEENLPMTWYTNNTARGRFDGAGNFAVTNLGRFAGWFDAPAGSLTGLAAEVGISSGAGWLTAYNRGAGTYADLNIQGTNLRLRNGAGTEVATVTSGGTFQYAGIEVGWRSVPRASYSSTPGAGYAGQCMAATGTVTIPASTFAAGGCMSIYNDSASAITLGEGSGLTLRLAGTTTTGHRTLAPRGLATIWFNSASEGVAGGSGLS